MMNPIKGRIGGERRRERGSIMPFAAIGMLTFVLSAGLAIDISHAYSAATELQNAADSAALAGATALNHTAGGIAEAVARARVTMNKYDISTNISLADSNIRFAANLSEFDSGTGQSISTAQGSPQNIRFVQVTIPDRSIGITLASSVIGNTLDLTRTAVAGQSVGVNPCDDLSKIILVEAAGSSASQGNISSPAENQLEVVGSCSNNVVYTAGCTYNSHLSPPCDPATKDYMVIDNPSTGFERTAWTEQTAMCIRGNYNFFKAASVSGCNWIGQELLIEPHVDAAWVRNALNTRFNQYTGSLDPDEFPRDKNVNGTITYSQYKSSYTSGSATSAGVSDRRVLVMPIVKLNNWNWRNEPGWGWIGTVKVDRYGVFFMTRKVNGNNSSTADFRLEAISDSLIIGDGEAGTGANAQLTVPVLYR
ncbi:MAG: pilus assembly protein TadG-related protein [Blastocatellia bacterium]